MKKNRIYYVVMNFFSGIFYQFIIILLGFCLQTVFMKSLGADYLGVKGLFSNILSMLSFTELGIGTAITYSLYQPIAEKDFDKINLILNLFRKIYNFIGWLLLVCGCILIPIVRILIHEEIAYVMLYYILFLLNTVMSYFFTYKRALLNADQLNYINNINQLFFKIVQSILQILVLLIWHSFLLYCIVQLLCTILSNISLNLYANKKYSFLSNLNNKSQKMNIEILSEIAKNTLGLMGTKISDVVINGTDNILISYFVNIYSVGIYSNYLIIINNLILLFGRGISAIIASIGNFVLSERNIEKHYYVMQKIYFVIYCSVFIVSICVFNLINSFMTLWLGSKYLFDINTVALLVINFSIFAIKNVFSAFVGAYGLYTKSGIKSIIEALLNLMISLCLVGICHMGVNGVIIGTIVSSALVSWVDPYLIMIKGMHLSFKEFFLFFIKNIFLLIYIYISMIIVYMFTFNINNSLNIFSFLCNAVVIIIISVLILFISFKKRIIKYILRRKTS